MCLIVIEQNDVFKCCNERTTRINQPVTPEIYSKVIAVKIIVCQLSMFPWNKFAVAH